MTDKHAAPTDARIDQVFFGWSTEDHKMGRLAGSSDEPEHAPKWLERLLQHIRLQPPANAEPPEAALSYLTFWDGLAAVVRRVDVGPSPGRNNSHAVIGPAEVLTVEAALGLHYWRGWQNDRPPSERMDPVPARLLSDAERVASERLPAQADGLRDALVAVLARLLVDPSGVISIVGCPEPDRPKLLWGLVQAAKRGSLPIPDWTFSTYEVGLNTAAPQMPRFTFLPAVPFGPGGAGKMVVNLADPTQDAGPELDHARQLVQAYLDGQSKIVVTPTPTPRLKSHKAVCVGLSSFGADPAPGAEPELRRWHDLPKATERVRALARAFTSLGYDAITLADLSARDLGATVRKYIDDAAESDVLVFHLFSHGYLTPSGSLRVIGADGEHHEATDVGDWLKKIVDAESPAPMTLFLLDVCHGGSAARLFWQPTINDENTRAWVIAAAAPDEEAYAGRFTDAVIAVLDDLAAGRLDIDHTFRYAPIDTIAQMIRRDVLRRATTAGAFAQRVTASRVDISVSLPTLPFFPNKQYAATRRRDAQTRIDSAVMPFLDDLDEALDPVHFLARAAGHGVLIRDELSGCFSGRRRELRLLSPWLNLQDSVGLRIVTGSPGAGKSALIGVLVCAAHPMLRDSTRAIWEAVEQAPYPNRTMAAVHARARTPAQIVASVARQLNVLPETPEPTATDLIAAIAELPTPPVVVIDALDEAIGATLIMNELLLPLAQVSRADGEPVRLLVGMRPWPEFAPLRVVAERDGGVLNLDDVDDKVLGRDVSAYVRSLLLTDPRWDRLEYVGAAETLARAVADTLTRDRANREWGAFLVAGLFSGYLLNTYAEPIGDQTEAITVGQSVPRTLPDLLDLDLRTRATGVWVRPILAAAAHAKGDGMPARLLGYVASALVEVAPPDKRVVLDALETVRFYLRHSAEVDGTTVYRLFHQGLADHLKQTADASAVAGGLLDSVHSWLPDGRQLAPVQQWDLAEPYLNRHMAQHAGEAGRLGELMADADFLVTADPVVVLAELDRQDLVGSGFAAYRSAAGENFDRADRKGRVQLLAMAAARCGAADLAQSVVAMTDDGTFGWQPLWVWSGSVTAISSKDRLVAFGTAEGAVTVLDLTIGTQLWNEVGAHGRPVTAVALGVVDGGLGVLSIDGGGTFRRRRLDARYEARSSSAGAATRLAPSVSLVGKTCAIVVAETGEASIWEVDAGTRLAELDVPVERAECFATGEVAGRILRKAKAPQDVVVQMTDGRQETLRHDDAVTAAAAGAAADVPVIFTGNDLGTIHAWDTHGRQWGSFDLSAPVRGMHATAHGELVVQAGDEIVGLRFTPNGLAAEPLPVALDTLELVTAFQGRADAGFEPLRMGMPAVTEQPAVAPQALGQADFILAVGTRTDRGRDRVGKDDAHYCDGRLVVVADGAAAGGASYVVQELSARDYTGAESDDLLREAFGQLADDIAVRQELAGTRVAVTAVLLSGPNVAIMSIGDVRVYRLRHGLLLSITEHDSRTLNGQERVYPRTTVGAVQAGDRYLICTRGLWDGMTHADIGTVVKLYLDPDETAEMLVKRARSNNKPLENITVVVADAAANKS